MSAKVPHQSALEEPGDCSRTSARTRVEDAFLSERRVDSK